MQTGELNAITDVKGVLVGHSTLHSGDSIHTGVTAILPHSGNIFMNKVPAGLFIGNGFGKLTGISQIQELGNIETPIILTNTLSVPTAAEALIDHALSVRENNGIRSVNPVVGETNDGSLNDIASRHVRKEHVLEAISKAVPGPVEEGNVGAGSGTRCFGFKGGIGTSSRKLPEDLGGYTVGVLVQTNFGGVLTIDGVPVGEELGVFYLRNILNGAGADGSCMIVVATDAPLDSRNLNRLSKRAVLGLARTGGIASNESGDYVISFSSYEDNRIPYRQETSTMDFSMLRNDRMTPLFMAVIEATEEAIINSLFAAETVAGHRGVAKALPIPEVLKILAKYGHEIKE